MTVTAMACSGVAERVPSPTWEQIAAALDRMDGSIWLEADGDQYLWAQAINLRVNGIAPPGSDGEAWGWLVLFLDYAANAYSLLSHEDSEHVPTIVAKDTMRNWTAGGAECVEHGLGSTTRLLRA